jgi:hypothetical protein
VPSNDGIADRLRELALAIDSMEEYAGDSSAWLAPHADTQRLLDTRRVDREQLNYAVPTALDLKQRVNAYNAEHGNPGAGNLVAGALDSWLRAQGYPPDLDGGKGKADAI